MDLEDFRKQLDDIDSRIIKLLGERLVVIDQVGGYKRSKGLPFRDTGRFEALLRRLEAQAKALDVPPELVEKIYHEIHEAAIAREQTDTLQ